jgi:uncharacterized protein YecE (DUF72 family)
MSAIAKAPWKPLEVPPDITGTGFYVGTSGYYFDDWVGRFNPPRKTKQDLPEEELADQDRLRFYQKYFRFVEINNTFYHEPMLQSFIDIEERSLASTLYAVKVNKEISHTKTWDVDKAKALMQKHAAAVSPLVETGRFYSFLIQLEDHVYRSQERLDYLLAVSEEAVKRKLDVHIEFRHNSWHQEHALQSLKDSGVGICNTEIPPFRHVFPLKSYATSDKGYIRYSGRNMENWNPGKPEQDSPRERLMSRNRRYDYLYSEEEIRERVKGQVALSKKTSKVAVAYNNHYLIQAVLNAIRNILLIKRMFNA